jgi:alpha-L-fucosidase
VAGTGSKLVKHKGYISDTCEAAPFVFDDRLLVLECLRPAAKDRIRDHYLVIHDPETGRRLSRFGEAYGLASLIVHSGVVHVFASRWDGRTWNDVTLYRSADLDEWESSLVLKQAPGESIFNTSVCLGGEGFVMAYESNDPTYVPFTAKFARSADLQAWSKDGKALFGPDRYAACPCLRYQDGYYYMLYLEHLKPDWRFETYLTRSRNLSDWEPSPRNPIISPEEGEDINTSDPDMIEFEGQVYLYYSIGDQRTYCKLKRATFPASGRPLTLTPDRVRP